MLNVTTCVLLITLLPLGGFLILGLFGRKYFRKSSGIIATVLLLIATTLALYTAYSYFFEFGKVNGIYEKLIPLKYTWLEFSPGVSIDMGILLDPITCMMLVVITFISLMVHI
nr:NADH-quinone oxidoreductase subunit L [Bacteroidota bacterium]